MIRFHVLFFIVIQTPHLFFRGAFALVLYYVDKTMYLPLLEETSDYLFLIRPRCFGKSLFVSYAAAPAESGIQRR